jgi:snurportin-1
METSRPARARDARRKTYADRRREATLRRQRDGKRDALAYARRIAVGEDDDARGGGGDGGDVVGSSRVDDASMDASMDAAASPSPNARESEELVTQPEWMWDDAPSDLRRNWYVRPRPRGARCLVVAARGKTTARSARDGSTLRAFQSGLPGGSARTSRGRGGDCFCILDCVYCEDERARGDVGRETSTSGRRGTYRVLDVVAWNGTSMYDCDAEFRFFWAHTRLTQECDACEPPNPSVGRDYAFAPTPWYECDADGVRRAYEARDVCDYEVDGLLFYHKEAAYDVGATPLVLLWRDAKTSAFFGRDEGAPSVLARAGVEFEGDAMRAHVVALAKSVDGNFFVTGDDDPIIVAAVAAVPRASEKVESPERLPPGRSGRFLVGPGGFDVDTETAVVRSADVRYLGPKPTASRGSRTNARSRDRPSTPFVDRADSLSKILFNARSRVSPLAVERLLEVAADDVMDDDPSPSLAM